MDYLTFQKVFLDIYLMSVQKENILPNFLQIVKNFIVYHLMIYVMPVMGLFNNNQSLQLMFGTVHLTSNYKTQVNDF